MFSSVKATLTTNASGVASATLTHGNNRNPNGFISAIRYDPGTLDTGADLVITGANSGIPILTKSNAGTSEVWYYPRELANAVADGAENTVSSEYIPIMNEPISVSLTGGGNTLQGEIEVILITPSPY